MTIDQHKKLLKLLEKLQKDTCAGHRIFKEFAEKVMEIFVEDK